MIDHLEAQRRPIDAPDRDDDGPPGVRARGVHGPRPAGPVHDRRPLARGHAAGPAPRPFAPRDLEAVLELDRSVTGEDRSAVLRELVEPVSTTVALGPDGDVRGFLVRAPWRGGAVIAPDPDDALRLLERSRHSTGVSGKAGAGVLAGNETGRARLRDAGWEEELGGVRMIRGEPLDWNPDGIWGQLNGALG